MTTRSDTIAVIGRKRTSGNHKTPRVAVQLPEPAGILLRALAAVGDRSLVDELLLAIYKRAEAVGFPPRLPASVIEDIRKLPDQMDRFAVRDVLEQHNLWPPPAEPE